MSVKGFEGFDSFSDDDTNRDYSKPSNSGSDVLDGEEVIKRLYAVTQSTIDTLDHYSTEDSVGYADIVRAAVYLLKNSGAEQRADAYKATRVIKSKTGPKAK